MEVQIMDNIEQKVVSALGAALEAASEIRIAVAFVSNDGLEQIMPYLRAALHAGASLEFLVGMDPRATDPIAVERLYGFSRETRHVSLYCFAAPRHGSIFHPKLYLMKKGEAATALIGSSNLTRRGLTTNIEANIFIRDEIRAEVMSDIFSTYYRLKYHPRAAAPDQEYVDLFAELCQREKSHERELARGAKLREAQEIFLRKAGGLHGPTPTRNDLVGWLELVYDSLPEGEFSNQEVYANEDAFSKHYPQNLNIRAKVRQQLQVLEEMGFLEHPGRGIWKKVT